MVREARLPQYAVDDPLDLPRDLWTPGWAALCERLRDLAALPPGERVDALWLVHRLCLHRAILRHASAPSDDEIRRSEPHAGIAYLRGLAALALANDGVADLDTTELERAA